MKLSWTHITGTHVCARVCVCVTVGLILLQGSVVVRPSTVKYYMQAIKEPDREIKPN